MPWACFRCHSWHAALTRKQLHRCRHATLCWCTAHGPTARVAARAPDANEDFVALSGKFPTMPVRAGVQNHDGFTTISEEAFIKYFANGVPHEKAEVLYAVQQPTAATLFAGRTTVAAWRTKPSWYAVSKLDETISPDLERFLANRMNAHTIELNAGHLSLVSHSGEIADLILEAAARKKQGERVANAITVTQ
ncbi:MAG TPA: alpha/beta fold hydrolase [Steroidobacteraceae bacterium]|nr:alpha/beta fold hydrolase [Steroidobacteraceae bacterium]